MVRGSLSTRYISGRFYLVAVAMLFGAFATHGWGQAPVSSETDKLLVQARELFNDGKYDDTKALLASFLDHQPDELRVRSLLVLVLIRQDDGAGVDRQADLLTSSATKQGATVNPQIMGLVQKFKNRSTFRGELNAGFAAFDLARVTQLIATADLSPVERTIADVILQKATGDFEAASESTQRLLTLKQPGARGLAFQIQEQLSRDAEQYKHAVCITREMLEHGGAIEYERKTYGPADQSLKDCGVPLADVESLGGIGLPAAFEKQISILFSTAPWARTTGQLINNYLLAAGSYDQFETFADKMLAAHGFVELQPLFLVNNGDYLYQLRILRSGIEVNNQFSATPGTSTAKIAFADLGEFKQDRRGEKIILLSDGKTKTRWTCDGPFAECFRGNAAAYAEPYPDTKVAQAIGIRSDARFGRYIKHVANRADLKVTLLEVPKAGSGAGGVLAAFARGSLSAMARDSVGMQAAQDDLKRNMAETRDRQRAMGTLGAQASTVDLKNLTEAFSQIAIAEIEGIIKQ